MFYVCNSKTLLFVFRSCFWCSLFPHRMCNTRCLYHFQFLNSFKYNLNWFCIKLHYFYHVMAYCSFIAALISNDFLSFRRLSILHWCFTATPGGPCWRAGPKPSGSHQKLCSEILLLAQHGLQRAARELRLYIVIRLLPWQPLLAGGAARIRLRPRAGSWFWSYPTGAGACPTARGGRDGKTNTNTDQSERCRYSVAGRT